MYMVSPYLDFPSGIRSFFKKNPYQALEIKENYQKTKLKTKKYKPVTDKEEYPLVQENHLESTENKNKHHRKLKAAKCFKNTVPTPC